ncbi:MAG TPA: amino acid synthesis family protein, partial [Acidimicrobiales bacterium]|nr:amino acid synthesis family protein [Acidimicrobiales bacterium]
MENLGIRKIQLSVERVHHAGGPVLDEPLRRGSIAAVLANPYAGRHEPDLSAYMESLNPLGISMAEELRDALIADGAQIEGYGKGAIAGVNGELELAAVWHAPGGAGLRAALGDPKAMVPAAKKVGVLGCQLDLPLVYLHASYLGSHYDVGPVVVP